MRSSPCGALSCSAAAVGLSTLVVVAVCFVYFDVAVTPAAGPWRQGGPVVAFPGVAVKRVEGASGPVVPDLLSSSEPGLLCGGTECGGGSTWSQTWPRDAAAASGPVVPDLLRECGGTDCVATTSDGAQATWPAPAPAPAPAPSPSPPAPSPEPWSPAQPKPVSGGLVAVETDVPHQQPAGDGSTPLPSPSCDYASGRWVRDSTAYPLYRVQDCPFADGAFRCQEHARPDREYEEWRWQPLGCDLPRFRPDLLLERLRNSRVVFVGDSLGRNQWESMLCLLASAVPNKTRVYEVDGNPITKHMGYLRFRFEDWNCSVEYYRSPYLVAQGRPPAVCPKGVKSTVKLDHMEYRSPMWEGADVLVFNAGHWWTPGKTTNSGVFFQVGQYVNVTMDIEEAFRISLRTWSSWMRDKVDPQRTRTFFRSFASTHFSGGTWNTGGDCHLVTQPLGTNATSDVRIWTNDIIVRELANVKSVSYLNITRLTDFRADGHPSIYGTVPRQPLSKQDCSHWCLPGVPDSWNEILVAELMRQEVHMSR